MLNELKVRAEQACAIPFRRNRDQLEFCLITSINRGAWGFPKGNISARATPVEAALEEAFEEAGLHGEILGESIGQYQYRKRGMEFNVAVYVMDVHQADDHWQEAALRRRRWLNADEAITRLKRGELKKLFAKALQTRMIPPEVAISQREWIEQVRSPR